MLGSIGLKQKLCIASSSLLVVCMSPSQESSNLSSDFFWFDIALKFSHGIHIDLKNKNGD